MAERDYAREYGNRCRQVRQAKNISQSELAERMHTTPQNVSKWEREGIANVNTVMQLSEVLGQDITCDQIDQEGIVGEIGQEILSLLVNFAGKVEYAALRTQMFGMSDERIGTELFKLERIGNVVREQYTDFRGNERDTVFITAKGVITIRNIKSKGMLLSVARVITYEQMIGDHRNLQEVIEQDKVSQLLWNLPYADGYRIDYIRYLKKNFRNNMPQYPETEDFEHSVVSDMCLTGYSYYIDTLYRMSLGLKNDDYEYDPSDQQEEESYEAKFEGYFEAKKVFEEVFPWTRARIIANSIEEESLSENQKSDYDELRYEAWEDSSVNHYEYWRDRFFEHVDKLKAYESFRWFEDDEIERFIEENYHPARTEEEMEIDRVLSEVNELKPETLEYYYRWVPDWESNGLAKKIRSIYGIPERK